MAADNAEIKEFYTSAVNYRVGGEYKIKDLSLRAGYGLNGSPVKDDTQKIFDTQYFTGGLGYRINEYYFDIAYQHVQSENRYSPYLLNGAEPTAVIKNANNDVFLTFGVRF
ncbi:Outer membrane protein transport protein (OMPP1/FadL/TodX) [compost metagenome]